MARAVSHGRPPLDGETNVDRDESIRLVFPRDWRDQDKTGRDHCKDKGGDRMNRILAGIAVTLLLVGCASQTERQKQYDKYIEGQIELAKLMKDAKPVASYEGVDSGGKAVKWTVNLPQQIPQVQQIKDDEDTKLWMAIVTATIPTVGNVATNWISSYYNAENQQAMWEYLGNNGSGIKIDSDGGNVDLTGSGNIYKISSGNESTIGLNGFDSFRGEGESSVGKGNTTPAEEEAPVVPVTPVVE